RHGHAVPALADVSASIDTEEFVALLGPSGCGKSTLLNLVAGLLEPTAGTVYFGGENDLGSTASPSNIRAGRPATAMVFQEFALFPWRTVQKNVELGLEEAGVAPGERARQAHRFIELTGLAGFEAKYPHQLSGGMRQRV